MSSFGLTGFYLQGVNSGRHWSCCPMSCPVYICPPFFIFDEDYPVGYPTLPADLQTTNLEYLRSEHIFLSVCQ